MINILFGFITSDLGKKILTYIALALAIVAGYYYILNKGRDYQKQLYHTEYLDKLNKVLAEQKIKQDEAYKQGFETANKEKQIEIKYIEKKVYIDKIVEKYKECKMTDEDFSNYMKELRDFK